MNEIIAIMEISCGSRISMWWLTTNINTITAITQHDLIIISHKIKLKHNAYCIAIHCTLRGRIKGTMSALLSIKCKGAAYYNIGSAVTAKPLIIE